MTTVVQHVGVTFTAASPGTITVTSTGANQAVVAIAFEAGTTAYTGFSVTDNATGGSSTWAAGVVVASNGNTLVGYALCTTLKSGATTITITPSGGSGGMYGVGCFIEASGGLTAVDKTGATTYTSSAAGPQTATATGADTGTDDLVLAGIVVVSSSNPQNVASPATGGAAWSIGQVNQDGSTSTCAQISYRVNASAVTDAATWSGTQGSGTTGLSCCAVMSFKTAAVSGSQMGRCLYVMP